MRCTFFKYCFMIAFAFLWHGPMLIRFEFESKFSCLQFAVQDHRLIIIYLVIGSVIIGKFVFRHYSACMHAFKSKVSLNRSNHKCCISVTWSVCLVGTYFNRLKAFIVINCTESHSGWISLYQTVYVAVFSIQIVSLAIMCLKFNLDQVKSNHDVCMQNFILKQSSFFETFHETKASESNTSKEWNKVFHRLFQTKFIGPFAAVFEKTEFVHHFWRVLSMMYKKLHEN